MQMKFVLLSLLSMLFLCGCSIVSVNTKDCSASYKRFWFEQEGFSASICGGTAKIDKTANNLEYINKILSMGF